LEGLQYAFSSLLIETVGPMYSLLNLCVRVSRLEFRPCRPF